MFSILVKKSAILLRKVKCFFIIIRETPTGRLPIVQSEHVAYMTSCQFRRWKLVPICGDGGVAVFCENSEYLYSDVGDFLAIMNLYKAVNIQFWMIFWFGDFCRFIEGKPCSGSASYKLSFQAEWSDTDGKTRPNGAKFSGLIGCSHNHCYQMWQPGRRASVAVKNVAEKGRLFSVIKHRTSELHMPVEHVKFGVCFN